MFRRDKKFINDLQKKTKNIRNFCILAHVDHGKTTLADTLLATNAIISTRMSGKLRYMDSRQDEQQRGITMKSSAISLIHQHSITNESYLINLIDSPGHVDFSTEVSTAVRLCDGAIILIDVCEGICPQTHAVLRQAWLENLKLILIFNKIDRLILELKMTPLEAYIHMSNILGQFNAIVAQQFTSLLLERKSKLDAQESGENNEFDDDVDESKLYFSPKYNNVFFASSLDGWGFGIDHFADIYANKLGFKRETLLNTLWGDFYLNAKTKRIMKNAQNNGKKPLFVQLVLENIWQVYDAVYTRRDTVMTEKIINSLSIKIQPRELKYTEPKGPLQALFLKWLPIGRNLLDAIVDILPSPMEITNEKVEHLICSKMKPFNSLPKETQLLKNDFMSCDEKDETVIVFISKVFATEKENIIKKHVSVQDLDLKRELIRQRKLKEQAEAASNSTTNTSTNSQKAEAKEEENNQPAAPEEEEQKYEFLAFARVFSGTLKKGQDMFILSPKHSPEDFVNKNVTFDTPLEELQQISKNVCKCKVDDLYLMMGRELEAVDEVPCGNIVAIGGLENVILKSATLSTTVFCPSFSDMFAQTTPIMRVAIEPKNPSKMKELLRGLKLLNQADPCVEVLVQENGEHILCTAGEIHLQRCLEDLVNLFAKVEVNISQPIIPFKETIVKSSPKPELNTSSSNSNPSPTTTTNLIISADGLVELTSNDRKFKLHVRAKPLPLEVVEFIDENAALVKLLNRLGQNKITSGSDEMIKLLSDFKLNLREKFEQAAANDEYYSTRDFKNLLDGIMSFGPNRFGPNILVNLTDDRSFTNVWEPLNATATAKASFNEYENPIVFGFNLATAKGPICEEPVQGVVFFLEKFQIIDDREDVVNGVEKKLNLDDSTEAEKDRGNKMHSVGAQCISLMSQACRKAFEAQPQRLMAAMFKCELMTVSSEALGKLYAVLGKRNAKILEETVKDNTNMFLIMAHVPVADSFGLSEEIRKRTSGLATLHVEFSHFEIIEIDPYWEPKTEEELLLYGDKADFENQARKYMNDVRKRKGLFVREKLVEHSEKQRTLIKD